MCFYSPASPSPSSLSFREYLSCFFTFPVSHFLSNTIFLTHSLSLSHTCTQARTHAYTHTCTGATPACICLGVSLSGCLEERQQLPWCSDSVTSPYFVSLSLSHMSLALSLYLILSLSSCFIVPEYFSNLL